MSLRNFILRTRLLLEQTLHESKVALSSDHSAGASSPNVTALEERILMSASPLAVVADAPAEDAAAADGSALTDQQLLDVVADSVLPPQEQTSADSQQSDQNQEAVQQQTLELVFLDSSISNLDQMLADLQSENALDSSRILEAVVLDASKDGIAQITSALLKYNGIDGMHIVSHGTDGQVRLGSTTLSLENLDRYRSAISAWQYSMSEQADILIYGCNVAATTDGQQLLSELSTLTDSDVAGSEDLTGSADLGGDWELEYVTGALETSVVFTTDFQESWHDLLDLVPAGGETLVNTSTPENQLTTPYGGGNVAMDANGNYVVVWEDRRSGNADAYAKVYNADGSVRVNEFRVHAANTSAQDWVNVAMADNGNFVVTWSDNRSGTYETYMRLFNISGTALTGETLVSQGFGTEDGHAVDFAADGSFVITWQRAGTNSGDIYFQRYNSAGVAQGGNTVANTTNTYVSGTQNHPDVAVNDDGSFVISWMSNGQDGSSYGMYAQRFTAAGAKVGGEIQLAQTSSGDQWYGTIDNDSSGNFVATWMSAGQDGSGNGIFARQFNSSGTALGNEFQVNTWTSGDQGSPNISVDDDGDFVITWHDASGHDGTGFGVYAQQYDSSGNAIGVETRIAQTTSNDQRDATVAIHGTSAVVVWGGNGSQSGQTDSSGVFMRQFSLTGLGAQTLVVTNTLDDGSYGSLRWAINYANTNSGFTDTINFAIGSGTQTISLSSALPTLTDSVVIDAWTQPGFSGTPRIIIDANGVTGDGFQLNSNADNSTIRGFVIRDFVGDGIQINSGSTGNTIEGNYIGSLNSAGTNQGVGEQNTGHGINILGSANLIGGTTAQSRNVIGGNQGSGIFIASGIATTNTVLGNYIGVDATGATALANDYGIFVTSTDGTIIGNGTAAGRNVISGNTKQGIYNWNSDSTTIQGNYIGTDATGTADLNGSAQEGSKSGIVVDGGSTNVLVGGLTAGQGNLISGNNWYGVEFWSGVTNSYVYGNYIGTDVTGMLDLGNTIGGVGMWGSSTGNVIGGGTAAHRNVISGNDWVGVNIGNASSATTVQGNYIGLGVDGSTLIGNQAGVVVEGGSAGSLIGTNWDGSNDSGERNIISGNQWGVFIQDTGTSGTMVWGNYIGTDATGLLDRGNTSDGILIQNGATGTLIGGSTTKRNVIAGNDGDGIQIDGEATDGTFIQNNYIGLAANGTTVLGNAGNGIHITGGADNTTIGGGSGLGNVIVGSGYNGIEINGASSGTTITGNYIGINAAGTVVAGNMMHGIQLINGVSNTTIGGTVAGQGNVITANGVGGTYTNGVDVFSSGTGNSIVGNSIYDNVGIGIDLDSDGVTANDNLDPDTGSNNLQNFPVITSTTVNAAGTTVTISGSLNTLANLTGVMLHFYATPSNGDVTKRDGRKYIGNTIVNTDASGNAVINIGLTGYSGTVAAGDLITATATYSNNTSEFSQGAVATLSTGNSAPSDLDTVSTTGGGMQINSDGGNDTILVADDGGGVFGGLTQMTIETQLAFTNGTADMTLMSYGVGGVNVGNDVNVRLYGDGTLRFYINGSFVSANSFNYSSLADGQQHSLAITWSNTAGAWEVYVDGTLRDSGTGFRTGATVQSGGTLAFGNDQDRQGTSYDPNQKFSGTLYDVRVFSDVRTATEIAASYRSDLPYTESGMLANWKFDQLSTAGVVTDTVSSSNLTVNHLTGTKRASDPSLALSVTENAIRRYGCGIPFQHRHRSRRQDHAVVGRRSELRYSARDGKILRKLSRPRRHGPLLRRMQSPQR
ncbi:MAG: DUF4347 domain-containing protein [Planctomycetaceae bacterium]